MLSFLMAAQYVNAPLYFRLRDPEYGGNFVSVLA